MVRRSNDLKIGDRVYVDVPDKTYHYEGIVVATTDDKLKVKSYRFLPARRFERTNCYYIESAGGEDL